MDEMADKLVKKVYTPPRLKSYGDVRQLTRTVSNQATNKDGGPNNTKSF